MSKRAKREAAEFAEIVSTVEALPMSSLSVVVDYCQLAERVGETEAFDVIGKLKDLLG